MSRRRESGTPRVETFFDQATFTATHVVIDPATHHAAIVDPVLDYDPKSGRTATTSADALIVFVVAQKLTVDWLLETHVHADHLTAAPYLKDRIGGQIAIGEPVCQVQETFKAVFNAEQGFETDGAQFDRLLKDDEAFAIGDLEARVMATPGHTPACSTYLVGDAAFVGDTLFMPDFGTARCDFPGGDARQYSTARSRRSSRCRRKPASSCATTTRRRAATNTPGRPPWPRSVSAQQTRPRRRQRRRFRRNAQHAGQGTRHAGPAPALGAGQHAGRAIAAARGQRRQLSEDSAERGFDAGRPQRRQKHLRRLGEKNSLTS